MLIVSERQHARASRQSGALDRWRDQIRDLSQPIGQRNYSTPSKADLTRLMNELRRSPTGAWLLDEAQKAGIRIVYDNKTEYAGYYESETKLVAVEAPLTERGNLRRGVDRGYLLLTLAHELRHAWQDAQGPFLDEQHWRPRDAVLINRLIEADAEAISAQVAYELKLAGDSRAWDSKKGAYEDMHRVYRRAIRADEAAARDGRAMRAAFDQWFHGKSRVEFYDLSILDAWEETMRKRSGAPPFTAPAPKADFMAKLGTVPGYPNYLSTTQGPALDDPAYREGYRPRVQKRLRSLVAEHGGIFTQIIAPMIAGLEIAPPHSRPQTPLDRRGWR